MNARANGRNADLCALCLRAKNASFRGAPARATLVVMRARFAAAMFVACSSTNGSNAPDSGPGDASFDGAAADGGLDAGFDARSIDAASDAGTLEGGGYVDGGCTGAVGVVAASAASGGSVWATFGDGATFEKATVVASNGAVASPAVAAFGTGFVGVVADASNALVYTSTLGAAGSGWYPVSPVASRSSDRAPSLALVDGVLHLVYRATDSHFFHGRYDGAWDAANDTIGGGVLQSFAPSPPTATAVPGSSLVIAEAASDDGLYDQAWTGSGSWSVAQQIAGAHIDNTIAPRVASLAGAGEDLVFAYAQPNDHAILFTTRTAASGAWSQPASIANAQSDDAVSIAPLAQGGALLVFRAKDGAGYFTIYSPKPAPSWSAPAPIVAAQNPALASAPSAARASACGDEAVVAFVDSTGGVRVGRYRSGAFAAPVAIAGVAGATYAAIASR
jgi:hypothetical protein